MTTIAAPQSISKRCIYCKVADQPLKGDGFRKRCADELACARRVAGDKPEAERPPHLSGNDRRTGGVSSIRGNVVPTGSPAQALIAMLQQQAEPFLGGPFVLGDDLGLPIDAVQGRYVLFGKTGSGKTNGSAVIAETCCENNVPVCVLDSLGNLHGLRADGDGKALPIPIIGGEHGDVPLNVSDAQRIAKIFARGQSMLIDLSHLSDDEKRFFGAELALEWLRSLRTPAHVIVEEAETLCPSFSRSKAHFAAQGAFALFARQIRNWGVGWTFSTQQQQRLHPDVVDAANVYLAMQSTGDKVQTAIGKEARSRLGKVIAGAIISELGTLKRGEAWLMPDPEWLGEGTSAAPVRFKFRKRYTYDSTAVPKIGQPLPPTPKLKPVDLGLVAELRPSKSSARRGAK